MFFAFLLLLLITLGGFALTYLYDDDCGFFTRAACGIVIGQTVFALAGFLLGCTIGMSGGVAVLAAVLSAAPVLLFGAKPFKTRARIDFSDFWGASKNFVLQPKLGQIVWAAIYAAVAILVWFFFERAMLNLNGGIGTGSAHNTGDISFHLQAIYGFLDGQNFPPQNPSYAGAKFTYPFMADLVTAMLAAVGARISQAMFWQNIFLAVALVAAMRRFTFKLTNDDFAANVAPLILLFSGGLGFVLFFQDALASEAGIFGLLMKLPNEYTLRFDSSWRWGNSLVVLFMTQRSLLLGLPLALIVLTKLWEVFSFTKAETSNLSADDDLQFPNSNPIFNSQFLIFNWQIAVIGGLAGTLPLGHAHSFAVLWGMAGLLALMSLRRWREWFLFFAASALIAVPELLWATTNSASRAKSFIDWEFGWDDHDTHFVYFWIKNTGFFIPLLIAAIAFLIYKSLNSKTQSPNLENELTNQQKISSFVLHPLALVLFWLPFALCFIVPNTVRLAPWIWDNIKVLIYWFVASIPLVALLLAEIWRRGGVGKAIAVGLIFGLTCAGFLDVFRVASGQIEYTVFDRDTVQFAREARKVLPADAIVMSAPVHDSPAALMGRRWFLGFIGHVWSHGIEPQPREIIVRQIYFGDDDADKLLRENNIQYLVISQKEHDFTVVNDQYLSKFPVVAEVGGYRLLQIK